MQPSSSYDITDESALFNELPVFQSMLNFVTNPDGFITTSIIPENDGFNQNRAVYVTGMPLNRKSFVYLTMHSGLESRLVLQLLNGMNPLEVVEFFGLSSLFSCEALKRVTWKSFQTFLPTMELEDIEDMLRLARNQPEAITSHKRKAVTLLSFVRSGLQCYSPDSSNNGTETLPVTVPDVQLMVKVQLYLKEAFENMAFMKYASTITPWECIRYLGLRKMFDPALMKYGWEDLTGIWGYIPCLATAFDKDYGVEKLAPIIQEYYDYFVICRFNALLARTSEEMHQHLLTSQTSTWASHVSKSITPSDLDSRQKRRSAPVLEYETFYPISELNSYTPDIDEDNHTLNYPTPRYDGDNLLSEIELEHDRYSPPRLEPVRRVCQEDFSRAIRNGFFS